MDAVRRNIAVETEDASTPPRFEHDFIDPAAGYDAWGGISVGDFDGDGRPELTTGGKGGGFFFVYDYDPATRAWSRSTITMDVSPQVSAAATDLDGDGRPEVVVGEWGPRLLYFVCDDGGLDAWTMHAVYEGLENPHDLLAADLTGTGRDDVVVREKDGSLYRFVPPADPTAAWPAQVIATELEGDGTVATAVTATK
ncbi:MAG: FG-GAP repeat domain-containing protein, partial [Spirochaetota bacterium]